MNRITLQLVGALTALLALDSAWAGPNLLVPQQFSSIQSAINAAPDGSRILVSPGTYRENLIIRKSVAIESTLGAAVTIMDGNAAGPVIYAAGTGTETVVIKGFTLTNGRNLLSDLATTIPNPGYGAVYLESVKATVAENVVSANVGCVGVGISALLTSLRAVRNRVVDNIQDPSCEGAPGGGLFITGDGGEDTVIQGNEIARNRISGAGAGIYVQFANRVSIVSNTIADNTAAGGAVGGGLVLSLAGARVLNNLIVRNSGDLGGGAALYPDTMNRIIMRGNVLNNNVANWGSAVQLVTYSDQSLKFEDNVARGNLPTSLVQCDGLTFVVKRSNVLVNTAGPELGGSCLAGR